MERIANFSIRYRFAVMIFWLFAMVGGVFASGPMIYAATLELERVPERGDAAD